VPGHPLRPAETQQLVRSSSARLVDHRGWIPLQRGCVAATPVTDGTGERVAMNPISSEPESPRDEGLTESHGFHPTMPERQQPW